MFSLQTTRCLRLMTGMTPCLLLYCMCGLQDSVASDLALLLAGVVLLRFQFFTCPSICFEVPVGSHPSLLLKARQYITRGVSSIIGCPSLDLFCTWNTLHARGWQPVGVGRFPSAATALKFRPLGFITSYLCTLHSIPLFGPPMPLFLSAIMIMRLEMR
jgi:hypothetical protein